MGLSFGQKNIRGQMLFSLFRFWLGGNRLNEVALFGQPELRQLTNLKRQLRGKVLGFSPILGQIEEFPRLILGRD